MDSKTKSIELSKQKFLTPKKFTVQQLLIFLHKEDIKSANKPLKADKSMFLTVNKKVLNIDTPISEVYHRDKADDLFLYLVLCDIRSLDGC